MNQKLKRCFPERVFPRNGQVVYLAFGLTSWSFSTVSKNVLRKVVSVSVVAETQSYRNTLKERAQDSKVVSHAQGCRLKTSFLTS